ncbi:MAG: rhomboid family intramembrane serine protease [Chlamydiia bacterium]|nr:rhomboid family intramembrane serine protease [Chlamydiia bacterium]
MSTQFSLPTTPPPIKWLLIPTLLLSFLSPLLSSYLALSVQDIFHGYVWQFITYLFLHPFPSGLLHLAFNAYLIWIFGAQLVDRLSAIPFLILYLGSGLLAGLLAFTAMLLFSSPALFMGSSPALYALLTSWCLLNADAKLLLFFALPFKARNVLGLLIGFNLLLDASHADWPSFFSYSGAILFGYLFTVLFCKTMGPLSFLHPLEKRLLSLFERLSHIGEKAYRRTKIYDFKSGKPILNDEEFMDSILSRISLYGKETLTAEEKHRMDQIAKKKSL